jgi:hypothetical protein
VVDICICRGSVKWILGLLVGGIYYDSYTIIDYD